MQSENITAGKLAEMIGVQPSAISHVMSGRNKPGFDFLAGLFNKFPNLNPRWMIIGEGNMTLTFDGSFYQQKENESHVTINTSPDLLSEPSSSIDIEPPRSTSFGDTHMRPAGRSKSIERIVIFYTDGTFSSHEQQ